MRIRFLNAEEVRQALPMSSAIEAMKRAYAQLSSGDAIMPLRSRIGPPGHGGVSLFMPAYLPQDGSLAIKIVSVFPNNAQRDLPTVHALVIALDPATGQPMAIFEGGSLTAIRTGAGSGAATDLLARSQAHVVAMIGSGAQAHTQLDAVCAVRTIDQVWIYSPHQDHARRFAQEWTEHSGFEGGVHVSQTAEQAVEAADIICTATTAEQPVFDGRDVRAGAHINAVGSYTPAMAEVDLETLRRSKVVVELEARRARRSRRAHPAHSIGRLPGG